MALVVDRVKNMRVPSSYGVSLEPGSVFVSVCMQRDGSAESSCSELDHAAMVPTTSHTTLI